MLTEIIRAKKERKQPKPWKPVSRNSLYLTGLLKPESDMWNWTSWESTATIKRPLATVINLQSHRVIWGLLSFRFLSWAASPWINEHQGDVPLISLNPCCLKNIKGCNSWYWNNWLWGHFYLITEFWFRGEIFTNNVMPWILPSSLTLKYSYPCLHFLSGSFYFTWLICFSSR